MPGLPSWWTGPWRILPECPATGHNVFRRIERPPDGIKCICPRAIALRDANLVMKRTERRGAKRSGRTSIMPTLRPIPPEKLHSYAAPDWTNAACRTPAGREASDRAYDAISATAFSERMRVEMKAWCHVCPLMTKCREWVLAEERPAGSWGGVWGGLDPRERHELVLSGGSEPPSTGAGAGDATAGRDSSAVG